MFWSPAVATSASCRRAPRPAERGRTRWQASSNIPRVIRALLCCVRLLSSRRRVCYRSMSARCYPSRSWSAQADHRAPSPAVPPEQGRGPSAFADDAVTTGRFARGGGNASLALAAFLSRSAKAASRMRREMAGATPSRGRCRPVPESAARKPGSIGCSSMAWKSIGRATSPAPSRSLQRRRHGVCAAARSAAAARRASSLQQLRLVADPQVENDPVRRQEVGDVHGRDQILVGHPQPIAPRRSRSRYSSGAPGPVRSFGAARGCRCADIARRYRPPHFAQDHLCVSTLPACCTSSRSRRIRAARISPPGRAR